MEEHCSVDAVWEATDDIAVLRLRVPWAGRLDDLARTFNGDAWIAFHDRRAETEQARADQKAMERP